MHSFCSSIVSSIRKLTRLKSFLSFTLDCVVAALSSNGTYGRVVGLDSSKAEYACDGAPDVVVAPLSSNGTYGRVVGLGILDSSNAEYVCDADAGFGADADLVAAALSSNGTYGRGAGSGTLDSSNAEYACVVDVSFDGTSIVSLDSDSIITGFDPENDTILLRGTGVSG